MSLAAPSTGTRARAPPPLAVRRVDSFAKHFRKRADKSVFGGHSDSVRCHDAFLPKRSATGRLPARVLPSETKTRSLGTFVFPRHAGCSVPGTRNPTPASMKKDPGCSKCRYASRGCRRCVTDFVTASEARAAGKKTSAAETAEAKKKASASGGGKKTDDTSSPSTTCAKKRGRPFGSKNSGDKAQQPPVAHTTTEKKRDSGSFQVKTPSVHGPDPKTADGNRNAFVSPPSTGKSAGDVNHGAGTGKAAREKMANAWDNDASSELDVRSGKPTKKVRWDVDGIDLRGETGEAKRHGEGHRHGDTDSTYREPTSRAFTVTTTTTTTTTATLPVGNQSVNSINSDDDMNALAKKLADFVGSYGSMDAKDLLGVPCGGQLLCEALARVAGV